MFFATRTFWTDLSERTVSTVAATAVGLLTASSFTPLDLVSWQNVVVAAGLAGLVSALKAFALAGGGGPTAREALASRGEVDA